MVNGDIVVVTWALFVGVVVEFDVAGVLLVQPATTMVLAKTSSVKARNLILEQLSILIYIFILALAQLIYYARIRLLAGTKMPPLYRVHTVAFQL